MSVRIQDLTIVIPISDLDQAYPCQAWGYVVEALSLDYVASVTADRYLTSVSFASRDDGNRWLRRVAGALARRGATDLFHVRAVPMLAGSDALGDIDFLDCVVLPDRSTLCWLNGTAPGSVAEPLLRVEQKA